MEASDPRNEWRHWPVLLGSFAGVALCAAHGYSLGVMIGPLEQAFGWTRAQISTGPFIIAVVAVVLAPISGMAIDRYGPRRIALFGVPFYCAAIALLSTTGDGIASWWARWMLIAIASMFVLPTVWTAAVNGLFSQHRGKALAVALCGTGVCAAVVPTLADHLIEAYGWRGAYVGLGAVLAAVVLPIVLLCFRGALDMQRRSAAAKPSDSAAPIVLPGLTMREGLRSPTFHKLVGAILFFSAAGSALTANGVPILMAQGLDRGAAAWIAGLIGIGSIVGRLGGGVLLDHFDAKKVAAISVLCPVIAIVLLLSSHGALRPAVVAALILGLSVGAEVDACAYLVARHFGMRSFGSMFGTINGLLLFTNGLAPIAANTVYDLTRSYDLLLLALIPLSLLASGLFLCLGAHPAEADRTPGEGEV